MRFLINLFVKLEGKKRIVIFGALDYAWLMMILKKEILAALALFRLVKEIIVSLFIW